MGLRTFIARWARHRWVLVLMMMGTYSVQSILITASKRQGGFAYDATAAVLLTELAKLCFAVAMLDPKSRRNLDAEWHTSVRYALPAVLYFIQNRLVFEALRIISPPEYQLLNNLKLLTTSVVYRMVMRRQLRVVQWLAMLLLAIGMALATAEDPRVGSGEGSNHPPPRRWRGIAIMVVVSWCSAFAGVANEYLIKSSPNVLKANVWLYMYGSVAALPAMKPNFWQLEGFTPIVWLVVLCNAVLGQTIAYLFCYADSIVKLHAVCAAMGFTTIISLVFFDFTLSYNAFFGYVVCGISLCLYYVPVELLNSTDSELLISVCGKRTPAAAGIETDTDSDASAPALKSDATATRARNACG